MATRVLLLVVFLLLTNITHSAEPSVADLRLERSIITVTDLDRALTLYRDVFGFTVLKVVEHDAVRLLGDKGEPAGEGRIREAWLETESSDQIIGLMEVSGRQRQASDGSVNLWLKLFAYEKAANQARQLGLYVSAQQTGENLDAQPVRERIIEDWDGNRILIYRLDNREMQAGECAAFGDVRHFQVFDDKQIFLEGSEPDSLYLVTTRSSCRNALKARNFKVADSDGQFCYDKPRIKFRHGSLRNSCSIERIESVPTCSEAHRRAIERRPDWRPFRNTPHYVCIWE